MALQSYSSFGAQQTPEQNKAFNEQLMRYRLWMQQQAAQSDYRMRHAELDAKTRKTYTQLRAPEPAPAVLQAPPQLTRWQRLKEYIEDRVVW